MITKDLPDTKCFKCGWEMNAASSVGQDAVPSSGDVSLCIECGAINIFADDMTLRAPTDTEALEVEENPQQMILVRQVRNALARIRQQQ